MARRGHGHGIGELGYRGYEVQLYACAGCEGTWIERDVLDAILDRARLEAHDAGAPARQILDMPRAVTYRPCPRCAEHMNRRNFARYSGVVVDECWTCGTYFDAGKLDQVLAFVRSGGLRFSAEREADELARARPLGTGRPAILDAPAAPRPERARASLDLLARLYRMWRERSPA